MLAWKSGKGTVRTTLYPPVSSTPGIEFYIMLTTIALDHVIGHFFIFFVDIWMYRRLIWLVNLADGLA